MVFFPFTFCVEESFECLCPAYVACCRTVCATVASMANDEDPYLWLEDVEAEKSLDWVRARKRRDQPLAKDPGFETLRSDLLAILDSNGAYPLRQQDAVSITTTSGATRPTRRALAPHHAWRSTARTDRSGRCCWIIDALGKAEGTNWVWGGADCLRPDHAPLPDQPVARRCRRRRSPVNSTWPTAHSSRTASSAPKPKATWAGKILTRVRRHRLRSRLDDRSGYATHRQAMAARHADGFDAKVVYRRPG